GVSLGPCQVNRATHSTLRNKRHTWYGGSGWIVQSEHSPAARLPRNRRCRSISIAKCSGRRLHAVAASASVDIADLNAALLIDSHVVEVEQVAADVNTATCPDATAL